MRVVVAPDKFKGSLTAAEVADAVASGFLVVVPDADVVRVPIADGGDGTVAAALSSGFTAVPVDASGPTGERRSATYARHDHQAIVELAGVCGLDLLPNRRADPLGASTYGLGQVLAHAITHGTTDIVLGIGGSASTDGGAGMVQALGARLLDEQGRDLPLGGAALQELASLDLTELKQTVGDVQIVVASDVDNPLLGPRGAAAVFGPQKGASPADVAQLERALAVWARRVAEATGTDLAGRAGAGAAGGTGFAALALLNAELRPGIELLLDWLDFDHALVGADLVITGEGSLDEQSLAGKAPVGVAQAAARAGVTTVAVAGRSLLSDERLRSAGISRVYTLADLEPDVDKSIANAAALLHETGQRLAGDWSS
ncbi:MAG TPA: glycerate kinase [Propionibacteriaceae bacterium]|jgi:glycerate kinase|nr:glycerate kinase [Propionibacteriaceae bacterium]